MLTSSLPGLRLVQTFLKGTFRMSIRHSLAALAGAALLALAGCSSGDGVEETSTSESSPASTISSTSTSSTPSSSTTSSPETPPVESTPERGLPSVEPAAPPPPPASPTATYMDPGTQYGEVCYSGTPDQWPNFVNPATGCGAVLNPNYVEPDAEPYIVECLFGTPGPTLMSDGTTQYTDYCWHLLGGPEYAQAEGDATTNFWKCMEAGGTEETCRQ